MKGSFLFTLKKEKEENYKESSKNKRRERRG
jgi:hypothetical protein